MAQKEDNDDDFEYFDKVIKNLKALDGQVLEPEFTKDLKLAKDEKGAYLDMLSDKLINEGKIDSAPEEYNIEEQDVINHAVQEKINKCFKG